MPEICNIRIGFRERNGNLLITLNSDLDRNEVRFRARANPEDLTMIKKQMDDVLTDSVWRIVKTLGDQINITEKTEPLVRKEFLRIAAEGTIVQKRIFGEDFLDRFHKLIGSAKKVILHIDSEHFVIPWEFLYDVSQGEEINYQYFWGYKYIIFRNIPPRSGKPVPNHEILVNGVPDVGLLADQGLTYVRQVEVPFLRYLHDLRSINLFILELVSKERRVILSKELPNFFNQEMQIIHFACHTRPPNNLLREPKSEEYCLLLTKDFRLWARDFLTSDLRFRGDPLIILNCCGTSPRNSHTTWSMVQTMLDNGARGVITTECIISDALAARFIQNFYLLMLRGVDVGEALFETRKHYLDEPFHNPLGLLYGLYAFPKTRFIFTQ